MITQALQPYSRRSLNGGMWDATPTDPTNESIRIFGRGRAVLVRHEDGTTERMTLPAIVQHLTRFYGADEMALRAAEIIR